MKANKLKFIPDNRKVPMVGPNSLLGDKSILYSDGVGGSLVYSIPDTSKYVSILLILFDFFIQGACGHNLGGGGERDVVKCK